MRMIDVIIKKRNGKPLTQEEFNFVANGAAQGTVPDYQLSAFLMACFLNPLSFFRFPDLSIPEFKYSNNSNFVIY